MIGIALFLLIQVDQDVTIKAKTVVADKVVTDATVIPAATGVTLDPVIETPERTARRDATEMRQTQTFRAVSQPPLAVQTTTSTGTVVSQTQGLAETACAQIGVVGYRKGCRPPKDRLKK